MKPLERVENITGLSGYAIAETLGISHSTWQRLKRRKRPKIDIEHQRTLARLCGGKEKYWKALYG